MKYLWEKRNGMAKGFLALAAFLAVAFWSPLTVRAYIQTQGTVVSDSAVIRQEANTNSNVIASIVKGDTVTINNEETDSSGVVWYKVFVDANTLGYVRGDLIQKSGDTAPVSNPATTTTTTTTTTVTPTETLSAPGDSAAGTNTGSSEVNTDLTVGANTVVTPIQSQGASVGSDNVRVRADASTNASIVTKVGQSTAITLTGQATGDDGKLWFQVSFIADGNEVTGFIREDFVQHTEDIVVLDQQPADDPMAELPEEPADDIVPEEPVYNADYTLQFEADGEGGEYEWFLYNNLENKKTRLSEILDAAEGNAEAIETANAQLKRDKIIIIILAIVLVFLALTVTLLLFRLRDTYYDDFDEYDDDQDEPVRHTDRAPRTVKPVQGERPAPRPSGGQERLAGGQRPAGNGQRPSGNGQNRPANAGQRPAGSSQNRSANAGQRPSGNGQSRPAGQGQRPAGSGQNRPAGQNQRPAGNGQSRPASAQSRPAGQGQARPSSGSRPAKQDAGWKAKNFMTEDDDLEFEFLNWDGEER